MQSKTAPSVSGISLDFKQQRDGGATLKRTGECFRWKGGAWFIVLKITLAYGWNPKGTEPPRGVSKKSWNGDYLTAQRQRVTSDDAEQLAQALKAAIADIAKVSKTRNVHRTKALRLVNAYWKYGLSDFVGFCRRGPFRITDDVCDN